VGLEQTVIDLGAFSVTQSDQKRPEIYD